MAADLFAPFRIYLGVHGVAEREHAANEPPVVRDRLACELRVGHFEHGAGGRRDAAAVADLAALLGVERGAVEDDLRLDPGVDRVDASAAGEDRQHGAVGFEPAVAFERRRGHRGLADADDAPLRRRIGTRALALLGHLLLEPDRVDRDAALARDLARQLERKAVGVVQHERVLAGDQHRAVARSLRRSPLRAARCRGRACAGSRLLRCAARSARRRAARAAPDTRSRAKPRRRRRDPP